MAHLYKDEHDSLIEALESYLEDQQNYLSTGYLAQDYTDGEDIKAKADHFRRVATVVDKLGRTNGCYTLSANFRGLAIEVESLAKPEVQG